jgi:membrane fusion protein (multidrug efflux system)
LIAMLALTAGIGGYLWWRHHRTFPSTQDAYVRAHVVYIAPRIAGQVAARPIRNFERVEKDQPLLLLDATPFTIAVQRAEAELNLARQRQSAVGAAASEASDRIAQRQSERDEAERNNARIAELLRRRMAAPARADQARYALKEAEAALDAARTEAKRAERLRDEAAAQVAVAEAALAEARLDLSYTRVTAPAAGVLGEIQVRPGDVAEANKPLFPLVEDHSYRVEANFKETDLARIRPGQPATIEIDLYPGRTFRGRVAAVSPASGAAFSLLPPENATGNWVKVTQRFPVQVEFVEKDGNRPFRVGASCTVTVDTTRGE